MQARALAVRRGARYLTAEDLIFLIRHDRAKVNRLRTYLSWKDVRKHAKDSGGDAGGGVEVEVLEDGADGKLVYNSLCTQAHIQAHRQAHRQSAEDHHQAAVGACYHVF